MANKITGDGVNIDLNFEPEELAPNLNTVRSAAAKIAREIEKIIRERTKRGVYNEQNSRLPNRYSTRPHFFDIREPRGGYTNFRKWMKGQGIEGRSKMRYVKLDKGYAQYRSIFRGTGLQYGPVQFELTGDMLRNMKGKWDRENGSARVTAKIVFSDRVRAGQRYSPAQKARFVNSEREFLYLTEAEAMRATEKGFEKAGMRLYPTKD
ncbi:hypothetical protein [Salinibacter phage M8CRM-1]|uniref:Uncharacterized protein n=1 Tax=Salinibacter phage M8CRM-1 TaxID=2681612 RepID=A0A2I6UGL0_9CAUD|nr:hypothetical protein FGG67_gp15 [Salinibacter phage M8CRM-1]AUO79128.1 hypothetical protein [Salinibacter phage M8CRM-1]